MRRIIGLLALAALLITPSLAFATGQSGIYVAPKFIYGFTQMNGMKGHMAFDGEAETARIGNKNDSAWGGALAIGYDFYKQNRTPVRAELEYAVFSNVSGKRSWHEAYEEGGFDIEENWSAKQKLQVQTLFVNAYYDFRNDTAFTPWVGAGLGMAFINSKGNAGLSLDVDGINEFNESVSIGSKTNTNFAWNVGAGVAYAVTEAVSLDLGYRFAGLGKAETRTRKVDIDGDSLSLRAKTKNVYMHQVMLGLRFTF